MTINIVGNAFKNLKNNKKYITVDGLLSDASLENYDIHSLTITQGVTKLELESIGNKYPEIAKKFNENFSFVHKSRVHKANNSNVLISNFVSHVNTASASLVLDGNNELINDHVTGLHISAMVLIEAARQLAICYCEHNYTNFRFVLNSVNSSFRGYVYPDDIQLSLRVTTTKMNGTIANNVFEVDVYQNSNLKSTLNINATIVDEKIAKITELLSN